MIRHTRTCDGCGGALSMHDPTLGQVSFEIKLGVQPWSSSKHAIEKKVVDACSAACVEKLIDAWASEFKKSLIEELTKEPP